MFENLVLNPEIYLRLLVAVLVGGIIGLEREKERKPAGFRTHIIVCLSATLMTVVTSLSFPQETARVAAGIVTGIGFLGAGTIIGSHGHVRGLTTAATLWLTSIIGFCIGMGNYLLSVVAAFTVFIVLRLGFLENRTEED